MVEEVAIWFVEQGLPPKDGQIQPTKILKKLMKKFPIKAGGDNWESKGHIVPKEALLQYEI